MSKNNHFASFHSLLPFRVIFLRETSASVHCTSGTSLKKKKTFTNNLNKISPEEGRITFCGQKKFCNKRLSEQIIRNIYIPGMNPFLHFRWQSYRKYIVDKLCQIVLVPAYREMAEKVAFVWHERYFPYPLSFGGNWWDFAWWCKSGGRYCLRQSACTKAYQII